MKNLTLRNIARVCRGVYHGPAENADTEAVKIITDSRMASPGCVFIPIVGERADGHSFIREVMGKGALGTLSERELPEADFPYVQVESSLQALKDIAEFYLEQVGIPVVGITGSVGKTSTKEVIAAVLKEKYQVLKTQGNFNNEIGLPLTIFRITPEDEIAVLEMGINHFGEMTRLAKIAKPDICVITNIGPCHLEFLGDRDGVLKAKTEIFQYMKESGHIILNGDDDKLVTVGNPRGIKPVFFGLDPKNPIWADEIESRGLKGMFCKIHTPQGAFRVWLPMPGRHMVYNALAATAVGLAYGLSLEQIRAGIESLEPVSGRFRMIETEKFLIVDDCYNASPISMKASLNVLQDGAGRRVAILGDMGELGEKETALHEEVGAYAGTCSIDLLICAGPLSAHIVRRAKEANPKLEVIYEENLECLLEHLNGYVKKGDTILVKASHYMQFEKVVEALEQ